MNGFSLALVVLTAVEPDCCFFPPPEIIVVDLYSHLPLLSDADDLPWDTTSTEQLKRCKQWERHYRMMRSVNGYCNGYWDKHLASLKWVETYWCLAHAARQDFLMPELARRTNLQRLKDFLGDELYRKKYQPQALPELPSYIPVENKGNAG